MPDRSLTTMKFLGHGAGNVARSTRPQRHLRPPFINLFGVGGRETGRATRGPSEKCGKCCGGSAAPGQQPAGPPHTGPLPLCAGLNEAPVGPPAEASGSAGAFPILDSQGGRGFFDIPLKIGGGKMGQSQRRHRRKNDKIKRWITHELEKSERLAESNTDGEAKTNNPEKDCQVVS